MGVHRTQQANRSMGLQETAGSLVVDVPIDRNDELFMVCAASPLP